MAAASGVWDTIFSNFHIEPDGSFVEREFQAAKHDGNLIWKGVVNRARTPRRAKQLGQELRLTEDELAAWNSRRVDVMLNLVDKKVDDWDYVAVALVNTGDRNIVEFNKHHDNFWGDCTCLNCYRIGANWLGETLMLIRRRLNEGRLSIYDEHTMHTLAASQPPHSRRLR